MRTIIKLLWLFSTAAMFASISSAQMKQGDWGEWEGRYANYPFLQVRVRCVTVNNDSVWECAFRNKYAYSVDFGYSEEVKVPSSHTDRVDHARNYVTLRAGEELSDMLFTTLYGTCDDVKIIDLPLFCLVKTGQTVPAACLLG